MDTNILMGYIKGHHGIDDPLNEDGLEGADVIVWINQARRRLQRKFLLRFSEFEASVALTDGNREYDLPAGWIDYESIYYLDTDDKRKPLEWINAKKRWDKKFPDRTLEGTPVAATQYGNQLIIGLVPDTSYTLYTSGHKFVTELPLGDDETDDFLDECWEATMYGTLLISAEWSTVSEAKQAEWKDRLAEEEGLLSTRYRTAKSRPSRIVTQEPGTFHDKYEED